MSQDRIKRKRKDDDGLLASKKLALTCTNGRGPHPVVVASKGIETPSILFEAYSTSDDTPDPLSHAITLRSSKHPRLDYTADQTCTNLAHYIVVLDTEAGTGKITPTHHAHLRSALRQEEQQSPRKIIASARTALGQEFGTKKAKKAIASRTINAITEGVKDDVKTAILEDVAEQLGPEQQLELAIQLTAKPIPRPNLDAKTVEAVYALHTLIPLADLRLLSVEEWQQKARAEENIPRPHRFTAFRIQALSKGDDLGRIKALRYVDLLLQFHDALLNARSGKRVPKRDILTSKIKDFPDALIDSVRRRFTVNDTNELDKWHMENLHTHICALTLYIDHFSTNISNIRDDLRLDSKTISQYFNELACKLSSLTERERVAAKLTKAQSSNMRMAKLNLPLDFPALRTGRRR